MRFINQLEKNYTENSQMTKLRVLSDLHIGAIRVAGTTTASRALLRARLLSEFDRLLPNSDLIVNGDLFDACQIDNADVLATFYILTEWLKKGHKCWLSAGNHDLSRTSSTISSFDLLGALLKSVSNNVIVVKVPMMTPHGYIIPHLPTQVEFNEALAAVPECNTLYCHCNYDNFFATKSDNSLNISAEQAESSKATTIVIGHEHHSRVIGKVILPGNQVSSSVSDWVSPSDKFFYENGALVTCAKRAEQFTEVDWKQLDTAVKGDFIRVTGEAEEGEATSVASNIAKFRGLSEALVITNAVNIGQQTNLGTLNLESVRAFDVWAALGEVLEASEISTLQGLE